MKTNGKSTGGDAGRNDGTNFGNTGGKGGNDGKRAVVFTIILPDAEQLGQMLANDWKDFYRKFRLRIGKTLLEHSPECSEEGTSKFVEDNLQMLDKSQYRLADFFASGWAAGYNECLSVVRGQVEAHNMAADMDMECLNDVDDYAGD